MGTGPQRPAPQQPAVLGEQDAVLPVGLLDQRVVARVVAVRRVNAEHP
jgi:hypothetical protein